MSKIMAVNSGSSSLKFQLFDMPSEKVLTSGNVERIGLEMGIFGINVNGEKISKEVPVSNHEVAVCVVILGGFKITHAQEKICVLRCNCGNFEMQNVWR